MTTPAAAAVQWRHRLGQIPLPASSGSQMVYALLELAVTPGLGAPAAVALNICLVLDQSLSMQGEKMARVREAAHLVLQQLGPADAVALVSFNDRATVVIPAQRNIDPALGAAAVDGIVPRGGTELAAGLAAGLAELQQGRTLTGPAISSLLVLTDGRTYGDEGRCLQLAETARRADLLITPLGIGDEWNEDLLETVAFRCGSHSQYLDAPAAIVAAFQRHIVDLRHIQGRHAELTLRTPPGARLSGIHRLAPALDRLEMVASPGPGEQTFALGNLGAGAPQMLLLEVVLPPVAGGSVDIAACRLAWQAAAAAGSGGQASYGITASVDCAAGAAVLDATVKAAVEKVMAYKLQKRAWQDLQAGNTAGATSKLRMVATRLLDAGEPDLGRTVAAEADHLEQHGALSTSGTKTIKYGTRGLGRTQHGGAAE